MNEKVTPINKNKPIDYKEYSIQISQYIIELSKRLMEPEHIPIMRPAANIVEDSGEVSYVFLSSLPATQVARQVAFWLARGKLPALVSPLEVNQELIERAAEYNSMA